ncbi:MAG TPA: hypothetical protein VIK27_02410 [Candidatus Aquilonibacter sp.]
MMLRYLARALVTSLVLWALPAAAPPPPQRCGPALRDLYSARALRRLRANLELRLLEARRKRVHLAYQVIAHRKPVDAILDSPDDAALLAQGTSALHLKQLPATGVTRCR